MFSINTTSYILVRADSIAILTFRILQPSQAVLVGDLADMLKLYVG